MRSIYDQRQGDIKAELYVYEQGEIPTASLLTLPMSLILGQEHRITEVKLQVWDSRGARVRVNDGDWETLTTSVASSGMWKFKVGHTHDLEPRINVATVSDLPLNIYQIYATVSVGRQ
jgi:hypothetical protein